MTYTFAQHQALATAWCRWNNQRGTERQALRLMRRLDANTLKRMLDARNVIVPGCEPQQVSAS